MISASILHEAFSVNIQSTYMLCYGCIGRAFKISDVSLSRSVSMCLLSAKPQICTAHNNDLFLFFFFFFFFLCVLGVGGGGGGECGGLK